MLKIFEDEKAEYAREISEIRGNLRSHITQIIYTFKRMLNVDKMLAQRLRTLFQSENVTIVSLVTAIGMIISTGYYRPF